MSMLISSVRSAAFALYMSLAGTFYCRLVSAESIAHKPRYASDGGNTDAGPVVYLPVGQVPLQQFNDLPAINQCLKLRGRAQVLEEISTFTNVR
jgi:hypothetical protein